MINVFLATNVHSICVRRQHFEALAKSIINNRDRDISYLRPVQHGLLNEEICRRRYVLEKTKSSVVFFYYIDDLKCILIGGICATTYPCGLVVDATASYLCCSPDALVIENQNDHISYGILECKCVYSESDATWNDLICVCENFCLEQHGNGHRLRRDHPYFYQMIVQLNILDLTWIDICILKGKRYLHRTLNKRSRSWCNIKKKLTTFYFTFLLPEIMKNVS